MTGCNCSFKLHDVKTTLSDVITSLRDMITLLRDVITSCYVVTSLRYVVISSIMYKYINIKSIICQNLTQSSEETSLQNAKREKRTTFTLEFRNRKGSTNAECTR